MNNNYINISKKWSDFKTIIDSKNLPYTYEIIGKRYHLYAVDGPFIYMSKLYSDLEGVKTIQQDIDDKEDFEDNYKNAHVNNINDELNNRLALSITTNSVPDKMATANAIRDAYIRFTQYLSTDGTGGSEINLKQNCSPSNSKLFKVIPSVTCDVYVHKLKLEFTDSNIQFTFDKFMNINNLDDGVDIRIKTNDKEYTWMSYFSTKDLELWCDEYTYTRNTNDKDDTVVFTFNFCEPIYLKKNTDDYFGIRIMDNLSGIAFGRALVIGCRTPGYTVTTSTDWPYPIRNSGEDV